MASAANSAWEERVLGDVIEIHDHKRIPLSTKQRSERHGPYPYYGASGIIDYVDDYLFDGKYLLVSEDGENLNSRKTPIAFFASGKFWVNNHAHIIKAIPDIADDYFLMSWIQFSNISGYITGAAQPKLSQKNLKAIKLHLPPLQTQQKIASVLSAYDDLIENSTRRIQILEEMAQRIYQEWFVNFRFPGHEQVRFVESPLRLIPEGWEVKNFSEVADLSRSGINPNRHEDEVFAHFSIPAFDESRLPRREVGSTIRSNKHLVTERCVLLSKINPRIPRVWLPFPETGIRAITSTEFLVLIPKLEATSVYLFGLCCSDEFSQAFAGRALGTSTSHQRVKPESLLSMPLVVPSQSWIEAYNKIAEPILGLAHALRRKNENLRRTRDLLLPKLISGEINVEHLDVKVPS